MLSLHHKNLTRDCTMRTNVFEWYWYTWRSRILKIQRTIAQLRCYGYPVRLWKDIYFHCTMRTNIFWWYCYTWRSRIPKNQWTISQVGCDQIFAETKRTIVHQSVSNWPLPSSEVSEKSDHLIWRAAEGLLPTEILKHAFMDKDNFEQWLRISSFYRIDVNQSPTGHFLGSFWKIRSSDEQVAMLKILKCLHLQSLLVIGTAPHWK